MNWEAIGAIAEALGAMAVVATLIYLALQIRQNTQATRSATRHAITESIMGPPNNFLQSESFRKTFLAHVNGEDLDPDQSLQLQIYCYITMQSWENMHYQYRNGMLTEEEWQPLHVNLSVILQMQYWRDYWGREQQFYSKPFREEVDQILSELGGKEDQIPDAASHLIKRHNT